MKVIKGQLEIDESNGTIWFNDIRGMCRLRISNVRVPMIKNEFSDGMIDLRM